MHTAASLLKTCQGLILHIHLRMRGKRSQMRQKLDHVTVLSKSDQVMDNKVRFVRVKKNY